jgi:hypothetical protein
VDDTRCEPSSAVGVVLLVLFPLLADAAASIPQTSGAYRVVSVEALLFYSDSGSFSADVLRDSTFSLWNAPTGGGSARGPSTATLLRVVLAGPPNSYPRQLRLRVSGRAGGRTVLSRTSRLGVFGSDGRYYSGFWLYDTGCLPVLVSAELVGANPPSRLHARLGFECGE